MKKKLLASALSATLLISAFSPIAASALSKTYYSYNSSYSGSIKYNAVCYNKSNNGTTITYKYSIPQINTYGYDTNNTSTNSWKNISFNPYDYFSQESKVPSQDNSNKTTDVNNNQNNEKPVTNDKESSQTENTNNNVSDSIRQFETEVVRLVNVERAKAGLSALKENTELSKVARTKSQDMRDKGYFSHTSPTYGSPFDMMKQFGIDYMAAGENIAKGQKTPEAVVNAWMNSDGHRRNILSTNFTEIGVGYTVDSNGTAYWTQMFIKPRS
ncbi:CAP domain-containing protein [Maledivibacter halophilus]|uniref:Uncharacterized protein, YkwD family n=1 Tax=Maledivibacter halophilus TaxID=36842 RepID=A0A1T5MU48_9FIRM|nr:CAP domain-containing protein [Maledivibacter halophilus]SKC91564.1 uncharacterized protein, YkwD family [Maledivibacter halophilus]